MPFEWVPPEPAEPPACVRPRGSLRVVTVAPPTVKYYVPAEHECRLGFFSLRHDPRSVFVAVCDTEGRPHDALKMALMIRHEVAHYAGYPTEQGEETPKTPTEPSIAGLPPTQGEPVRNQGHGRGRKKR
jgi:hypothetical protein